MMDTQKNILLNYFISELHWLKKLFIYILSGNVLLTHGIMYQEEKRFLAEMI